MDTKNEQKELNATRATFIRELKSSQNRSWDKFYNMYSPLIVNFARKRGCSPTQAEDVLQETVLALLKVIPNFNIDRTGKFRSLLYKITESKIIDAYRKRKKEILVDDPEIIRKYQEVDATENASSRLTWDKTWENFLLSEATKIVIKKVQPLTYKCFHSTFIKGEKVKDVAANLGIPPNLVAQHKHKVYNLIIKEAEKLNT